MFEGKTTAERNKTIAAAVLGLVALVVVARMFFGGSTPAPTNTRRANSNANANARQTGRNVIDASAPGADAPAAYVPREISYTPVAPGSADAGRNIFAFYVAPTPAPKPSVVVSTPTPTPTPPPPLALASISPSNVYARTGDFTLQVSGDKFTPQTRVYFNGQELQTKFVGPQQLTANVPAALIGAVGMAQVIVRTPDGALFSNPATINIAQPPVPDYTFVGVLIRPHGNDTAMLKDRKGELYNLQRGDLVGGRYRVTSISTRNVELTDSQLKIKHTIAYTQPGQPGQGGPPRPSPPPTKRDDDEDAEP
ncbi:MAG TPA: IPT/TIG domain-containing protein [Pyrinomonadaceae bacterium]|nr:IPT/TIG domain-containing protein [Pyrinomonadaceae bacterium]